MPRRAPDGRVPDWNALYESAAGQDGYVSLEQAGAAGYSPQLLQHYLRIGKVERSLRGVLRLVHFPAGDNEDLVPAWLWSKREGVFGLQTALAIHDLSDAMPARHHLVVPKTWAKRRVQAPEIVRLYVDDVPQSDRQWFGAVPVTTPARTLRDCIKHHAPPDIVAQALAQAVQRKLISRGEARAIERDAS